MAEVIIEGSLMPAAGVLERGERKTVQLTPRIERLVANGFIKIVEYLDEYNEGDGDDEVQVLDVEDVNEAGGHALDEPQPEPPGRNASRDDWAEYLAKYTDIVTEGKDRTELLAAWDDYGERLNASG